MDPSIKPSSSLQTSSAPLPVNGANRRSRATTHSANDAASEKRAQSADATIRRTKQFSPASSIDTSSILRGRSARQSPTTFSARSNSLVLPEKHASASGRRRHLVSPSHGAVALEASKKTVPHSPVRDNAARPFAPDIRPLGQASQEAHSAQALFVPAASPHNAPDALHAEQSVVQLEAPQKARTWWGKSFTAEPEVRMPEDARQKEAVSFAAPDVDEAAVVIGQVKFLGPLLRKGIMAGGSVGALYAADQAVRSWSSDKAAYPKLNAVAQSKNILDGQEDATNTKPHFLRVLRREARDRLISLIANTVLAPGSLFMGINLLASAELFGGLFEALVPLSEMAMLPAVICMAAYGMLVALKSLWDMAYGIRSLADASTQARRSSLSSMLEEALPLIQKNYKKRIYLDAGLALCGLMQAAGAAGMFLLGPIWLAVLLPGTLGLGLLKWYRTGVAGEWPVSSEVVHIEGLKDVALAPTTLRHATLATILNDHDQHALRRAAAHMNHRAGGFFARVAARLSPWYERPVGQISSATKALVQQLATSRLQLSDEQRAVFTVAGGAPPTDQSQRWRTLSDSYKYVNLDAAATTDHLVSLVDGLGLLPPLVEVLIKDSLFADDLLRDAHDAWKNGSTEDAEVTPADVLAAVCTGYDDKDGTSRLTRRADQFAKVALSLIFEQLGSTLLQQQALYADLLLSCASAPDLKA